MEKYQAPPLPFIERLLLNGPLQVFVALLILSGMGLYLINKNPFQNQVSQKQDRMSLKFVPSHSSPGTELASSASAQDNRPAGSDDSSQEGPSALKSPPKDNSANSDELESSDLTSFSRTEKEKSDDPIKKNRSPSSAALSDDTNSKETGSSGSAHFKPRFQISIFEMQILYRDQLIQSSEAQGLFSKEPVFPSGILIQPSIIPRSVGQYSHLVFSDQKVLTSENPNWKSLFAHQVPNGGPTLGLEFELQLIKASSKSITLTVFVRRQWFSSLEGAIMLDPPIEFGQIVELEKGQSFFGVGLFPAQSFPGEKALLNTALSKIVSSANFKNRLTDFIFVIDEVSSSK
jgi:hypothetical protein